MTPETTMPVEDTFTDFIRRIRAGDAQAAAELVRRYEAVIRLEVRLRLRDGRLRRVFDSLDVCQSVLASFFVRATAGQFDLDRPEQLLRLLVAIARNKVAYQARRERSQCRDHRRVEALDHAGPELVSGEDRPDETLAVRELLAQFRRRLTAEEMRLADLRAQGRGWAEIAAEVGGTPTARRMQLTRAVERIAQQLGLEEMSPG
jgi:RNA polymerase sigma-70 factor (ECF subfamily)